eukprot:TRINITY_DN6099_c0_g1_i1.p1 TRINITY_DN6099_c0_g1~~TRINITY_DN6099_c0_g1_i1.p1  ORF type:complete len:337 (+),score=57.08 TRINITY_DN6099_c0_g1_i1:253-1263(+)
MTDPNINRDPYANAEDLQFQNFNNANQYAGQQQPQFDQYNQYNNQQPQFEQPPPQFGGDPSPYGAYNQPNPYEGNNNQNFGGGGYEDIPSFDTAPPQNAELNFTAEVTTPKGEAEPAAETYSWYHINHYRPYFDVDSKDVVARVFKTVVPIGDNFFEFVNPTPDLYGPFWITTTVIFLLAAASSISQSDMSVTNVSFAAAAIYGYWIVIPIVLWALCKWWLEVPLRFTDHLCIYGYSFFVYIPATFILLIPANWLRWIIMGIAGASSTLFIVKNYYKPYLPAIKKALIVLLVQAALHVALMLTFKFKFFNYTIQTGGSSGTGSGSHSTSNSTLFMY